MSLQLSELWTVLGGNRDKLENFASHQSMLSDIDSYRKQARAHVSSTLTYLLELSADLDNLRDRISRPALINDDTFIPIEVHLDTIRMGVQRLEAGRKRAAARNQETIGLMQADVDAQFLLSSSV